VKRRLLWTASGPTEFFVSLDERADLNGSDTLTAKSAKSRYVHDRLRSVAAQSQAPVIAAREANGASHRSFWITNAIAEANRALADGDAQRDAGHFKNTVNKYKDALAKAEGA
jgi:hypothetical protein